MEESTFKSGDVVQLKSGGPAMTITGKGMGGGWLCQWFHKQQDFSSEFPPEALKTYTPPRPLTIR